MGKHRHTGPEELGRYFSGECSPEEARHVEAWRDAHPANAREFQAMRKVWEGSQPALAQPPFDTEAALRRVKARTGMATKAARRGPEMGKLLRVAAVLVAAVGLAVLAVRFWPFSSPSGTAEWVHYGAKGQPAEHTLPDGSKLRLNRNSQLAYLPPSSADGPRKAILQGEAYFEIAPDSLQPFIVEAGGATVRVVGTAFNLRVTPAGTEVAVAEGKVRFGPKGDDAAPLLRAGHSARLPQGHRLPEVDTASTANALYWIDGRLSYRDIPLETLVPELSQRFGQPVRMGNPAIGRCRLSASFEQPSLASILSVVSETFNLELAHDANGYLLDGAGCR